PMVLPLIIAIALATVAVLAVMIVSLARHARRLAGAVADLDRAVQPLVTDIRAGAERASVHARRIEEERERVVELRRRSPRGRRKRRRRG
ncbi:MAG: hypothetical protein M3245_01170, partial [Actinomycetota bacterium]|nr:hypothetical protein [Actinomycetota bacterium]